MKRSDTKALSNMCIRYGIAIILGLGNLTIIYSIATPLTVHMLRSALSLFTTVTAQGAQIYLNNTVIHIIPACVAGAAYFALFVLILATPMTPQKRIRAIIIAAALFFTLNLIRLVFLISIIDSASFETIHWATWHGVSTLFIVATWILTITIHKITAIPFYDDAKYLVKRSKARKRHA